MKTIRTPVLEIAFETGGPEDGRPVFLLHGWPDDATAWRAIAPALEAEGYRWVAPWLRGSGATRFLSSDTLRGGSGVAIAHDVLDLADALGWGRFAVVGHDWGGRAAYILAAVAPERVTSISSLAIGYAPRGRFAVPTFEQSRRWWYQWFMATDGGAQAVRADPVGFARMQWDTWGPTDWFDDSIFAAVSGSFQNPDWAAITLHGYRSRWKTEAFDPRHARLREKVDGCELLAVPALMIQGAEDLCDPPGESEGQQRFFTNGYHRLVLHGVGHFPARENPHAVAGPIISHLNLGAARAR